MKKLGYTIICISIIFNLFLGIGILMLRKSLDQSNEQTASNLIQINRLSKELGLANSAMTEQADLAKKYKSEIDQFPKKMQELIDKHKLELHSRDKTIASLKNKVSGGTTVVVEVPTAPNEPKKISYDWKDADQRFHLTDPDIFVSGNETFEASQLMTLKGWVFSDENGKLQIRRVELNEVREVAPGKYEPISGSKAEIVDSTFDYAPPEPKTVGVFDVINPKLYASFDTSADPGIGIELFNLGKLVPFANVGLGAEVNPDVSNVFEGSLSSSRLGLNATYKLLEPLVDSNLGIALGVSTPANDLGGRWELTADAIFYLTN